MISEQGSTSLPSMAKNQFEEMLRKPAIIVGEIEHGYKVPDENWLATIERLDPPLFEQDQMAVLRHILDPQTEKRGGKSLQAMARPLVESLGELPRPDLPTLFVNELINRLESGVRYTRVESDRDYAKRFRTEDRNRIIVYLYDYIYDELDGEPETITHDVFGAFKVPKDVQSQHKKTLRILHTLLAERSKYPAPSEGTLMKIVSEAAGRKRSPRK